MCVPVDIPCPITEARLVNDTGAVVPDRYKWTSNGRKYVIELTRMPDGVMSSPVRPLTELTMNAVLGSMYVSTTLEFTTTSLDFTVLHSLNTD